VWPGSGSVEYEQGVGGLHAFRFDEDVGSCLGDFVVVPDISVFLHLYRLTGAFDDDNFLDTRHVGQGAVGGVFDGDGFAAAEGAV
jgi:hypothetical protein